nr:cecropin-1/3-like [Drosophila takahashii]
MNFIRIIIFAVLIMGFYLGKSEANFLQTIREKTKSLGQGGVNILHDVKEKTEDTFRYIKNATLQVIEVGQKAADVAATARGQKG